MKYSLRCIPCFALERFNQWVKLELTSDNDPDLQVLTKYVCEGTFSEEEGWDRLALVLRKLGKPKQAEEIYRILLEQESDESQMGFHYNQLGLCKSDQGEYDETIPLYQKAIATDEKYHPNSLNLTNSYNNIGLVYRDIGESVKALSSHEKALAIRQQSLPPNHPDLALTYNNIGVVDENMKNYSKAYSFYEKAVKIGEQSLPLDHPHRKVYRNKLDRVKNKL